MVITELRLRPVSIPFVEPAPWRYGTLEGITTLVVEVETSDGLVGLGEAPGIPTLGVVRAALESMRSWLIGEDPRRVARFLRLAGDRGGHHYPHVANVAVAGVEMALWDLCGKHAGCAAHQFFGGIDAERLPFYWHVNAPDLRAETVRARAREGLALGFDTLYLKVGFDIDTDLSLARAVRDEVGPGVRLRLDPNEAWAPLEVLRRLPALEALELEFLEQPFELRDHLAAAELRRRSRVPVAANQSAWFVADVDEVLSRGAADVVVSGLFQLGGMCALRDAVARCRVAGVPFVRHSLCDLGIATAASLHVLAASPPGGLAHQTHLTLVEHDLTRAGFRFESGSLAVPDGPGLGVELDEEAVARYEDLFRSRGDFASYGGSATAAVPAARL